MKFSRIWPVYTVIALGAAIQLFLVCQPLSFLLTNILPDDAFYYFQIARNIVIGDNSTFDGINLTNGYHPLWMIILIPIYALFSQGGVYDVQPVYVALVLSVGFAVGTALLLRILLSRITSNIWIQTFAIAVWSLNPFVIYETINGLETSLALFLLAGFFVTALWATEKGPKAQILVGCIAGLLILARLDMACFVIAYAGWMVLRYGLRKGITRGVYAAVPTVLIFLPWVLYNVATFGMLLTSASGGNQLINHVLVTQDNGTGPLVMVRATVFLLVYYGKLTLMRTGASWLVFVVIGIATSCWLTSKKEIDIRRIRIPLMVAFFGGFVLLFLLNAGVRFTGRSWYFVSGNLFLACFIAWTFERVTMSRIRLYVVLGTLSLLMLASFVLIWHTDLHNQMANQEGMYKMATVIHAQLPSNTTVGVFNAGIIGYFSGVRIVNLDGLVNNAAYEAMKDRNLWSYIQDEDIHYIADFPIYISYRYRSLFGIPDVLSRLKPLRSIDTVGANRGDAIILYSVPGR